MLSQTTSQSTDFNVVNFIGGLFEKGTSVLTEWGKSEIEKGVLEKKGEYEALLKQKEKEILEAKAEITKTETQKQSVMAKIQEIAGRNKILTIAIAGGIGIIGLLIFFKFTKR